ncbi:MAG: hypothetical protein Q7U34_03645 [Anaerolineales bacterium]|nr:hypothetical protein [Anaerolineales bacterium]MDP3184381.1 hypothetical protein [Anaerolineales bacterium]
MGFLKKLFGGFITPGAQANFYPVTVKCKRCGEVIEGRVNLNNDLSETCDAHGNVTGYFCRKVLMGYGRCYQQIEVRLTFDPGNRLKDRQIVGGHFAEEIVTDG